MTLSALGEVKDTRQGRDQSTSFIGLVNIHLRHGRRPAYQWPLPNFSLAMIDDPTVIHH